MSQASAFAIVPRGAATHEMVPLQSVNRASAAVRVPIARSAASSELPEPSVSRSSASSARALMATVATGIGAGALSQRRRRHQRRQGCRTSRVPRRDGPEAWSSESVLELAKKANVKLEVKPWQLLSHIAKEASRGWFVKRAEERGIEWSKYVEESKASQPELDKFYNQICDPSLEYPDYFTQPFHGYDEGNLTWKAAHELMPATQSMCLSYYDGLSWQDAQEKFRGNARSTFTQRWMERYPESKPMALLDMGCSGGFSTEEMVRAFPGVAATGLDLSPHFLAIAKRDYPEREFVHRLAEDTRLPDESFDVVSINFLLHEVPLKTSLQIISEAHRLLKPGGMLAILDVDPKRLLELRAMRRWAFQVTEPWCKDGEYFSLRLDEVLPDVGFEGVTIHKNDPVNAIAVAFKPGP